MARLTRRGLLAAGSVSAGAAALHSAIPHTHPWEHEAAARRTPDMARNGSTAAGGHAAFRGGTVDHRANGFDPHEILRDFDWGTHAPQRQRPRDPRVDAGRRGQGDRGRARHPLRGLDLQRPHPRPDAAGARGRAAADHVRQRAPSTRTRSTSTASTRRRWTACPASAPARSSPARRTVYEFDALPFGLHLYHCHVRPLAEHIAKGLYGAFLIDPKEGREDADEMVMVMNGFDTNFDRANEVYAANTIGFAYMEQPIQVKRDELVRIYLVNVLEYDLINSFHLHGNLFHYIPTGTSLKPSELTDTVMLCQGQRGILEWRFPTAGRFMFHAHQSEFTELGWQGFFEVT